MSVQKVILTLENSDDYDWDTTVLKEELNKLLSNSDIEEHNTTRIVIVEESK